MLLLHSLARGGAEVESVVRVLNAVFWMAAALVVAALVMYELITRHLGDGGASVVTAIFLTVVVICSGVIAL